MSHCQSNGHNTTPNESNGPATSHADKEQAPWEPPSKCLDKRQIQIIWRELTCILEVGIGTGCWWDRSKSSLGQRGTSSTEEGGSRTVRFYQTVHAIGSVMPESGIIDKPLRCRIASLWMEHRSWMLLHSRKIVSSA